MTWNISSEHASNIHDLFLHGALNVKTWVSSRWVLDKLWNKRTKENIPKQQQQKKNTHKKKQTQRCQRRSGRKLDSIYKSSSRKRLSFHFLPETEGVFLHANTRVSRIAAHPYLSLGIPPLAYVLVQLRAVCGGTGCEKKKTETGSRSRASDIVLLETSWWS